MARKRTYTEQEKAIALTCLEVNQGNLRKTARDTGVPLSTLSNWSHGDAINEDVRKKVIDATATLEQKFDQALDMLVESVPGKIEDAPLTALTGAIGTLFDRRQILRGGPTSITQSQGALSTDDKIIAILAWLEGGGGESDLQLPPAPGFIEDQDPAPEDSD